MTPAELDAAIGSVVAEYEPIAAAYLFGSCARGDSTARSDLDVGIVFRRRVDSALTQHRMLADMASRLEGLSPSGEVDVVVLESQGPAFQHRALREGRVVYEGDRERRIDFESEAHVRYFDWRPTYEIARRGHRAGFRRWLESRR
jgi:predicted nucleotidyltransferase